jgi:hypothetical protein
MSPSEQRALTSWIVQTEGQIRTRKEFERARGTHSLDGADIGTSQDMEKIHASEEYSRTG